MLDTRSGSFYLSFIHFCHFADKMNKVAAAAAALGDDKLLAVPNKVCFLFCFLLFFLFRSLIKWQTQAVYHFIRWWRAKWVQQQQQKWDFSVSKKEKRMEKIKTLFTATQEWRRLQQQQQQPSVLHEKSTAPKKLVKSFGQAFISKAAFHSHFADLSFFVYCEIITLQKHC